MFISVFSVISVLLLKFNMQEKKTIYLVCNAHLDPVWLWEWEEGLAETLSTFRIAAEFCENYEGFVFNHNESLLYEWVEEYDHELFQRIKKLVREEKWHIMGGWYVQPDCNIPSGESIVRQILTAKKYFFDKFSVVPVVAANLDPFGHSRGLVQILKKSGYEGYLFCRPDIQTLGLSSQDFIWEGYNNSEIPAHLSTEHYNNPIGTAHKKIRKWIEENPDKEVGMIMWGIGDHGGGPSKEDLEAIDQLKTEFPEINIIHSTPEAYFQCLKQDNFESETLNPKPGTRNQELETRNPKLETKDTGLNPFAVGCYTSMAEVKKLHRKLENLFFSTERMVTNLYIQGLCDYPENQLKMAMKELLFCEFHDILPGSSISEVETCAVQRLNHGLQIINDVRAKAFFRMISGFQPCKDGEFPLFVYNPMPYDIDETVVCEFQPQQPNYEEGTVWVPELYNETGDKLNCQLEKQSCNILDDQRKRVVFKVNLKGSTMHRFSFYLKTVSDQKLCQYYDHEQELVFDNGERFLEIDKSTGLIKKYTVDGQDYLKEKAFFPVVMNDNADAWGMKVRNFRDQAGRFELLSPKESAEFAGVSIASLAPVRIIENGDIRTIVESLLGFNNSRMAIRYIIPKTGREIGIEIHVYWFEKDKFLKLSIPTTLKNAICLGQDMFGIKKNENTYDELVAQQWIGMFSIQDMALSIINDRTYGFDRTGGELRLSLLRSPAYAGHPVEGQKYIVRQDRFEPRIDQGYHVFRFWMNAGRSDERLERVNMESQIKNADLMAVSANPPGKDLKLFQGITISDPAVSLVALKKAEDDGSVIVRLFESTGERRKVKVRIPWFTYEIELEIDPFEIKSIAFDLGSFKWNEVDLLERNQGKG